MLTNDLDFAAQVRRFHPTNLAQKAAVPRHVVVTVGSLGVVSPPIRAALEGAMAHPDDLPPPPPRAYYPLEDARRAIQTTDPALIKQHGRVGPRAAAAMMVDGYNNIRAVVMLLTAYRKGTLTPQPPDVNGTTRNLIAAIADTQTKPDPDVLRALIAALKG